MKSAFESGSLPRRLFGSLILRHFSALTAALACAAILSACATQPAVRSTATTNQTVDVDLVAINDFHGNLERSTYKYVGADHVEHTVKAGGIDTLGAALQAWRAEDHELLLVGAGDLIGASPAISSTWADEPSIDAMNMLGLRVSSVGNHEFDQGRGELLRQQNGGCVSSRPDKACQFEHAFGGAKFVYLVANVIDKTTGKPFLPAYRIEQVHGVKIGFIGAVLKGTPSMVLASGIAGLDFADEAQSINRVLPELRAQGVNVFVVLIHQGGYSEDGFDEPDCRHLQGPIVDIVEHLDPAIRLIISGHTHTGYTCRVDGRMVTQADMGGHLLTRIKLTVNAADQTVREVSARNVVMLPDTYPEDPAMSAYLNLVKVRSKAVLERPVAHIAVSAVGRSRGAMGESALGDLAADSMLAAVRSQGVRLAFMNNGGLRSDLEAGPERVVNFGQAQIVLPFGNTLVAMTLTGAQIRSLLEQQWRAEDGEGSLLQVSAGFSYRWDSKRPMGQRVLPGSVMLNGVPIDDAAAYRVAVNNFVAEGGDGFSIFAEGTNRTYTAIRDIDAFTDYLRSRDREGKPAGNTAAEGRIARVE